MKSLPQILPAALSGLLLGITTIGNGPVYHLHWAIFFGFVPLWALWMRAQSGWNVFFTGWICQFVFTLVAFHWIAYTVNEFGHIGMPASIAVLLFYCMVANLQFPLAGVVWHWAFQKKWRGGPRWAQIAGLALLTALFERIGTTIFHWNFGYAWLYMGWPGVQLADIAGFRWLCTFSICLNGFFLLGWLQRGTSAWWKPPALAAAAFAVVNLLGWANLQRLPAPDSIARVLVIQPNIGNREKEKLDQGEKQVREAILRKYFVQTETALRTLSSPPDFTLWPENAFPSFIDPQLTFELSAELKAFLRKNRLRLVTGGFGIDLALEKSTNSLFALSPEGEWESDPYNKIYLLPFGEYVPLASTFPRLRQWMPRVRDYAAGKSPVLLESGGIRIGPQICYEGLFDSVSRDLANLGAQIIVNVTNDSWYGDWMEPWQHFYITMAKAIETRRPLVRGTNTGLSAVIHADGTIPEISPISSQWFRLFEVPYAREPGSTIFMRWGYWIDWIFLALGLLAALASQKFRRQS